MLFLATTKMRQMKIAEPSIVTAHTSGSARSVFWRQSRVVTAPITTPNSPVTQVMAPKIKLEMREKCIRCQKCNVCICTLHFQRYVYVGTCLCCCMVERYSSLLSSAPPELWPGTAGSRSQTPPWQMTRPPMPEMKIHNCDYRAERKWMNMLNSWIFLQVYYCMFLVDLNLNYTTGYCKNCLKLPSTPIHWHQISVKAIKTIYFRDPVFWVDGWFLSDYTLYTPILNIWFITFLSDE